MARQTMIWVFFWGVVTGVGICFAGALVVLSFYVAFREELAKQQNEKNEEG